MQEIAKSFSGAAALIASGDATLFGIVLLSLEVSLSAVLLATLLGLPLGAAIAVGRFPGRRTIIVLLNALMGLPPQASAAARQRAGRIRLPPAKRE